MKLSEKSRIKLVWGVLKHPLANLTVRPWVYIVRGRGRGVPDSAIFSSQTVELSLTKAEAFRVSSTNLGAEAPLKFSTSVIIMYFSHGT